MESRLLILTATPPDKSTFGGRFLQELIAALGKERVAMVVLDNEGKVRTQPYPTLFLKLPPSPGISKQAPDLSKLEETVYWLFRQRFFARLEKKVQEIVGFASANNVSHIIAILDHPAIIRLTKLVASCLRMKYSTYLSEIPETRLQQEGYDEASKALIQRDFADAVKAAYSSAFASQKMAEHYKATLGVKGNVILAPEQKTVCARVSKSNHPVIIGCLLHPMHQQSVKNFIAACQNISWMIGDRPVSLRLLGSASGIAFTFAGKPAEIEILGGLSKEETIQKLADCTFNFLPFWTDMQYSLAARLSLSDDLPIYLDAQRPLLANAAEKSQVGEIIKEFSLGDSIEKLDENSFTATLDTLVNTGLNDDHDGRFADAFQALFSRTLFLAGLESLLPPTLLEKKSTV